MKRRDTNDVVREDGDEVVRDGESVKVSFFLMDARQRRFATFDAAAHQPGYRFASDAAMERRRHEARDAYIDRTVNAWKQPRDQKPDDDPDADDPANAVQRERELERWQGRDPAELARDLEVKRREIDAEHRRSLENAWKTCPAQNNCARGETPGPTGVSKGHEWRIAHH